MKLIVLPNPLSKGRGGWETASKGTCNERKKFGRTDRTEREGLNVGGKGRGRPLSSIRAERESSEKNAKPKERGRNILGEFRAIGRDEDGGKLVAQKKLGNRKSAVHSSFAISTQDTLHKNCNPSGEE